MLLKAFKGFVGTLGSSTNTYLIYDEKTFEELERYNESET